jgi:hypothetical protein
VIQSQMSVTSKNGFGYQIEHERANRISQQRSHHPRQLEIPIEDVPPFLTRAEVRIPPWSQPPSATAHCRRARGGQCRRFASILIGVDVLQSFPSHIARWNLTLVSRSLPHNMKSKQIFISYSGHDAFEASLLQYAIETMLASEGVTAWTYQRDQERSEKEVAAALKENVRNSLATIFLVSPSTIDGGAAQWMELAYSDAFGVKTFVLLHHLEFDKLKAKKRGVPPLLLAGQCNFALEWKIIIDDIRKLLKKSGRS